MESRHVLLSIIIPAYNEEGRIAKTLRAVALYTQRLPYGTEILVVDDGSKDRTVEVVKKYAAYSSQIRCLQLHVNEGKGAAVRLGMLHAKGSYRVFMDADGSTAIEHWKRMKSEFARGADVVVGSRHVDGAHILAYQPPLRRALGAAFRWIVRRLFSFSIKDTQNGFKGFTAESAVRIFSRQRVKAWAFDVEVLAIAKKLGYHMQEMPVTWIDDRRSQVRALAMPRMLRDIFRIWAEQKLAPRASEVQWERIALQEKAA